MGNLDGEKVGTAPIFEVRHQHVGLGDADAAPDGFAQHVRLQAACKIMPEKAILRINLVAGNKKQAAKRLEKERH